MTLIEWILVILYAIPALIILYNGFSMIILAMTAMSIFKAKYTWKDIGFLIFYSLVIILMAIFWLPIGIFYSIYMLIERR